MRSGRSALGGLLRGGGLVLAGVVLVVALMLLLGNGATDDPVARSQRPDGALACEVVAGPVPLPAEVRETSGLARGVRDPGLLWTHNDSGDDPVLYAIGEDGRLAGAVAVEGAGAEDWEDLEAAPCRGGGGPCLYIADTGDNDAERDHVTVYVVPEPAGGQASVPATALHARYPDGPRDAEGLFVTDGRIHVVTKGREGPIRVYRFPASSDGPMAILEPLATLAPRPDDTADYVTAATATPGGAHVALRTYRSLLVLDAAPLLAGTPGPIRRFDLTPLGEPQGEGVIMDDGGNVVLTSERRGGVGPVGARLACALAS